MKLRGQILLASLLLTVLPLVVVMQVVRHGVEIRLTELDTRRVEDQIRISSEDLDHQARSLASRLAALSSALQNDNRFRLAAQGVREDLQPYLVDYAPRAMSLMNLDLLLIQDQAGRVLSSGHQRGAFGTQEPLLPSLVGNLQSSSGSQGRVLLPARSAEGPFLSLARTTTLELGGERYHLTGGIKLDSEHLRSLGRDEDLAVMLIWPSGVLASRSELVDRFPAGTHPEDARYQLLRQGAIVRSLDLPLATQAEAETAVLLVLHQQDFLARISGEMDRVLLLVLAAAVLVSVLLAAWLAGRLSAPLRRLAALTEGLDLDRLDVDFASNRKDEVGHLSRILQSMTQRLRDSVGRLRAAEHRATLGEVARQVNHDIRNGLTPLRNVLRHLGQLADDEPEKLEEVFQQRRTTLEEGLSYLEDLATHYARLSPGRDPQPCNLAEVVAAALAGPGPGEGVKLENRLGHNLPPVLADPVSLRRIFENLVRNALESLPAEGGTVAINGFLEEDPDLEEMRLKVEVSDTGCGITPEHLDKIFNDFFTTREQGTGLGLSNVRRLAADCGASVRVASQEGVGTTFTLSFPLPAPTDRLRP
jgi:signal transduction histidine kinase